jgi:hypothetical protein
VKRDVIDGWECWVEGGFRIAESEFSTVTWRFDAGLTGGARQVPTRVLGWLIKPMLRTAYAEGWSDRNGQLDGAGMPRVYEDS